MDSRLGWEYAYLGGTDDGSEGKGGWIRCLVDVDTGKVYIYAEGRAHFFRREDTMACGLFYCQIDIH